MLPEKRPAWFYASVARLTVASTLLAVVTIGCAPPPAKYMFDQNIAPPAVPPASYDDSGWATVLRENVKQDLVDYVHLSSHSDPLDNYLQQVMYVGPKATPKLFPTRLDKLCYYINVYNACILKIVLAEGVPDTIYDVRRFQRADYNYMFKVDGVVLKPARIRDLARTQSDGDARIEFAMCGGAVGCPPLSIQPLRPHNVTALLKDQAQNAMGNPALLKVDHERQQLQIGLPIWSFRDAFKKRYCKETNSSSATMLNCLMHMADGQRREYLAKATGYDERILPFDRALNAWRPKKSD